MLTVDRTRDTTLSWGTREGQRRMEWSVLRLIEPPSLSGTCYGPGDHTRFVQSGPVARSTCQDTVGPQRGLTWTPGQEGRVRGKEP